MKMRFIGERIGGAMNTNPTSTLTLGKLYEICGESYNAFCVKENNWGTTEWYNWV